MNDSYFPHDSNARNSDKLIPVRMKYGAEGYGIYYMILERLREEKNYMSIRDYNTLAFDLRVDTSKIKAIIEDFGLFTFTEDGECFYSKGFNKRMEYKDAKSKKRSEAGKKGATKRWQKDSNAIALPQEENSKNENANAIAKKKDSKERKQKESKGNKSKGNKSKENNYVFGVFDFLEKNHFGNPYSEPMATDISEWVKKLRNKGLSDQTIDEWMILGAKKAAGSNKRFWNYVNGTLRNWDNVGAYTEEEIENQKRDKSNNRNPKNRKQATNYGQTLYTYYEQELRFSPTMTFDDYVAKKRLNERDRLALEQYIHSLEDDA